MTNADSPYKLLLVDDDEDEFVLTRATVDEMSAPADLDWVDNADDALKLMLQDDYNVYLVDHYLGDRTGIDLLKAARERGCRAPVIILTGSAEGGLDIDALDAGATDYLEKHNLGATLLERSIRYSVRQQDNQNRLEDLVQKVTRLEQLKTDMIRIAAHDLRTPLTVMNGYIEMLVGDLDDKLEAYHREYFRELNDAVVRMRQLVGDILSLERIAEESGGYTLPVAFSNLVREAFNRHDGQTAHQIDLQMPEDDIIVYGSEAELREAVENLVANAVKYTQEDGGHIVVDTSLDADSVVFTVQDNGYGIPQGMQAKLFQPFYRAKSKETRRIDGSGLGLHLVKNIIERHNGSIIFESEYGSGSLFGFMLPIIDGGHERRG